MPAYLAPWFVPQFFKNDGTVAAGCYLYTYDTGTTTNKAAYQDQAMVTTHANPIVLDSAGRIQPALFLDRTSEYRFRLTTSTGTLIDQWDDVGIDSYTTSGTYTPTLTNTTNIAASTANLCHWLRVGDVVHVAGTVDIDPTAGSTLTTLDLSLPVASNFTGSGSLAGTAVRSLNGSVYLAAVVLGNATADGATIQFYNDADTGNRVWRFTFSYVVL